MLQSSNALPKMRPNKGMQRTALCAHKIAAILKAGFSPTAFPIYRCAAADAQAVSPQPIKLFSNIPL
jgi:hypothetical protein